MFNSTSQAGAAGENSPRLVSLTGADDLTPLAQLVDLGQQFQDVEWALLYVPGKDGNPRNPTQAWREKFFASPAALQSAVHLCGKTAFNELLAESLPADIYQAGRIQLNINARQPDFSDEQVIEVFWRALELGPAVILQYHADNADVICRFLAELTPAERSRVDVLLDDSRGRGKVPSSWSIPAPLNSVFCGFAGGLGPDNMAEVLVQLASVQGRFWVDMESGIRTFNQFDLAKARQVLQLCFAGAPIR